MGWGGDRLCQTSPIPGSPDGDKKVKISAAAEVQWRDVSSHSDYVSEL